jgi:predicted ATPase
MYGWALARLGGPDAGIEQLKLGLAACEANKASISRPHFLSLLAEALVEAGRFEEGLDTLKQALAVAESASDRYYEAEVYRLKGTLLLAVCDRQGDTEAVGDELVGLVEAEDCFRSAIEIARGQQAKSLELRAAVSLSRLYQKQGKHQEARRLLSEVYGWFTEGFDTLDLKQAMALITALN